jgi:acetamidase/formamidase
VPGVRFPGLIHPGLIGTAPSADLLKIWNTREKTLVDAGSLPHQNALSLYFTLYIYDMYIVHMTYIYI